MNRVTIGLASGAMLLLLSSGQPAVAEGKNSWTFKGSFTPGEKWQSKVIYVPEGRYRLSATSNSFPCPDDGGEYCVAGQFQACVNEAVVNRAPGNRGYSDIGVFRPRNSPDPASRLTGTDMHDNVGGNGRYYIEVSDLYALNNLPEEMALAGFTCDFTVTLKKVG